MIDDLIDILNKQNTDWNSNILILQHKSEDMSDLKRRIKYCKNHMERKKLQQELNTLYKNRRRK